MIVLPSARLTFSQQQEKVTMLKRVEPQLVSVYPVLSHKTWIHKEARMSRYEVVAWEGKEVFVGIDLHRKYWHVSILSEDDLVLYSERIVGNWPTLRKVLNVYREASKITVCYEAGYFGYWLHDELKVFGADVIVVPPTLVPTISGNRVKTDKKDSLKLARFLQKGLLHSIYVPSEEERVHRQILRRRRQLVQDRVREQNRIKAFLRFYGIELDVESKGKWSQKFLENLRCITFALTLQREAFVSLLDHYAFLESQVRVQTQLLRDLSRSEMYEKRVDILCSIPGIGWLSAMEILLELQDVSRFQKSDQLAAYVGLTPSQYSSGEHIRLGRITRQGKDSVRTVLIQASWRSICYDPILREIYDRIKVRSGGKKAIVAVARKLLIRARHLLLSGEKYQLGFVAG